MSKEVKIWQIAAITLFYALLNIACGANSGHSRQNAQEEKYKIAVYVSGDIDENEKKALNTRILAALVNSGRYIAIERSEYFLAQIDKEHIKQRSGAIDDGQISKLGKQYGVQFICIANITPAFGSYQISARIINVETAEVTAIGEADSQLKSMADFSNVSDEVVASMLGIKLKKAPMQNTHEPVEEKRAPDLDNKVSSFIDSRDGRKYRAVKIAGKVWMAENLNYEIGNSWCYENDRYSCDGYGRLYDFGTAMQSCPEGWRLPTSSDFSDLVETAGGFVIGSKHLRTKTGWQFGEAGTDILNFSALPGGTRTRAVVDDIPVVRARDARKRDTTQSREFSYIGTKGYWWGAGATYMTIEPGSGNHIRLSSSLPKYYDNGYSVRCVQD